jgi:outer membrane protein insertion porin family
MQIKHILYTPLSIFALFLCLTSCNVNKFLERDQYIVKTNAVKVSEMANKKAKKALEYELTSLYKQKELPSGVIGKNKGGAWYYFKSQRDTLPNRFRKWQYKNFAKPPALFSEAQSEATVSNMKRYLENKGYLYPSVYYDKDFHNQDKGLADVIYHVDAGKQYVLDTIDFVCADTSIQYLLSDSKEESFLKKGAPLSNSLYEQERTRITTLLNNFGYARFTPNFIDELYADTSKARIDLVGNRLVNITLLVQMPSDGRGHLKFSTADVIIYPNYDARLGETIAKDTIVDGKIFFTYDGVLSLKPQVLSSAVTLQPGGGYRKADTDNTIRQLTGLGLYKFVNVRPNIEDCDSTMITYKIYLTPNKKMSIEGGLELNYANIASNFSSVTGGGKLGRIGVAFDLAFENKNLLKGGERFRTALSAGIDKGLTSSNNTTNGLSADIRVDNILSIPKFVNLSKSWQRYNNLHLTTDKFYQDLKKNATTDFNISYILSDRLGLNQYRLQQFSAGTRYVLKRDNGMKRFNINHTSVDLILSQLTDSFKARIDNRTQFSFQPQLMTGFLFRSFGYEYNGKPNRLGERWQYQFNIEQSGSEVWVLDKLIKPQSDFKIKNVDFSKFWRAEFDARYTRQFSSKRAVAIRTAMGIAVPFSNATSAPYSRLFFVGGPNSIRAWLIRGVGPGSFYDKNAAVTVPFQAGDIKIEYNSEYRFPVFWRFESAIFFDAGNVWNLKETEIGTKISKFWLDDLAVGTGIGLRLDVTYALIRLDFGYKLRTPYAINNESQWIGFTNPQWRNFNPNFALGFPF